MPSMRALDCEDAGSPVASLSEWRTKRRSIFYAKTDIDIPDKTLKRLRRVNEVQTQTRLESVRDLCRTLFGTASTVVNPFTERGTFHLHYLVALPGGQVYLLRVNALSHLYREFELHVDEWVMRTLKQRGLPSLPVLLVDLSRKRCSFDYELIGAADGRALDLLSGQKPAYMELVHQLGSFAAALHDIATDGFGLLDVASLLDNPARKACGVLENWEEYITLNLKRHVTACVAIGAINGEEAERIHWTFGQLHTLLETSTPSLLHGDLANRNVIADGDRITGVIDWEDCLSGDPVFDIAFWATFRPHENLDVFLDGYTCIRSLPPDFEMRFWLYYLRISLSKTVHRQRFGYVDRPEQPPASLRIQHSLKEIESLL